jgi:protein-tyrosine phosphatase
MGRPHARTLTPAMRWLRRKGITTVVSTLTEREVAHFHMGEELRACRDAGLDFFWWPIPEYGVPNDADAAKLLPKLADRLLAGEHVVIHCRMAFGRSPMVAAALLADLGVSPAWAYHALSVARGRHVPARASQRAWVLRRATQTVGATAING